MPDDLSFLAEPQVRKLLCFEELIPAMRQALADVSAGLILQPVRTVLSVAAHSGWFATMPAVYGDIMGVKMVTFYPGNVTLRKHTHLATIQLFRSATGEPLLTMDGRLITEMRTAAVSAVATDLLASPHAHTLAILGSGVQARSHYAALSLVRNFRDVRVWSRTEEHARSFAAEVGARVFASPQAAVEGSDVVLTLTSSPTPILQGRWLKQGALVCAVGAVTPDRRELDTEAMLKSYIVVESREAAQREPGDILIPHAPVSVELGELLNGAPMPQRSKPIVFKSVGIAAEDIAAAKLVYGKWLEQGGSQPCSK